MNEVYEKLQKCYESVREKIDFKPKVALVLGSGLGDFANYLRQFGRSVHVIEPASLKDKMNFSIDRTLSRYEEDEYE